MSPHLDDAAFSAGATLAELTAVGHEVTVATCFTRTVPDPTGFALACQLDKGLGPEVDYMALRREEDRAAMAVLGAVALHLDLPEAPHRGYDDAAALFAGPHPDDGVAADVTTALRGLRADVWLAPQGLGGHVDHLQVLRAVAALDVPTLWWRDAPYVLRAPDATPGELPGGLVEVELAQDPQRRAAACACYASQLGFQFGGVAPMRTALAGLREPMLAGPTAVGRLAHGAAAGGPTTGQR